MRFFRTWVLGFVAALLLFIGFVVATAPAKLFLPLLALAAPQLQLAEPDGTLWQGKSPQAYWRVNGSALDLGVVEWTLSGRSLLALQPTIQLKSESLGHRLALEFSVNTQQHLSVSHLIGRLPLSMLEPWLPLLIAGDVDILIDDLVVDISQPQQPELVSLGGLVNLQQAVWLAGDEDMLLGDYQADLSSEQQKILIDLSDHGAALSLNGLISLEMAGSYLMNAHLTPQAHLAPEISQSLKFLGKDNQRGGVLIDRKGRWR